MSDVLSNEISKSLDQQHIGELSPGSVGRRYEPAGGLKRHRERIHKESKFADDYKNLPFTFSKPKKDKKKAIKVCANCGNVVVVTKYTVGIICSKCKKYSTVREAYEE